MIAEIGHFALVLAFCASVAMTLMPWLAERVGEDEALLAQRRGAAWLFGWCALAVSTLMWCFLVNDFSVAYVASHSHSTLAWGYRLAALWGSHEGSILLWSFTLAAWTAAVAWRLHPLPARLGLRLLAVLGAVAWGLLSFILFASNPFGRLLPAPIDGADLNALLQDPGMAFHPPALYLGYVGFAVPFAFAVASLWVGRLEQAWVHWLRPWVLWTWAALGLGMVLGSSWAYRVLGWGGWWFWDPVENASLLPWLTGVALLHATIAAAHRGVFKRTVLLLCIAAFGLSLIGTFIVRSGTVTSVHAFAADPGRGVFILALLALGMGGSLWLYAWRSGRMASPWRFAMLSRESMLMGNVLVFSVATATVLLATLYPMAMEALGGAKISVGQPYFEAVMGPLLAPAVVLMGMAPMVRWGRLSAARLARSLKWSVAASFAVAAAMIWPGGQGIAFVAGMLLGTWALVTACLRMWRKSGRIGARAWGAVAAHAGVGVFVLALTVLKSTEVEREVAMAVGDSMSLGGYQVRLDGLEAFERGNHSGTRAVVSVWKDGRRVRVLRPETKAYRTQDMTVASPDADAGLWRDLYVAMGQRLGPSSWALRIQLKPMMVWVWIGFLMMGAGGVLAAWPSPARSGNARATSSSAHAAVNVAAVAEGPG